MFLSICIWVRMNALLDGFQMSRFDVRTLDVGLNRHPACMAIQSATATTEDAAPSFA